MAGNLAYMHKKETRVNHGFLNRLSYNVIYIQSALLTIGHGRKGHTENFVKRPLKTKLVKHEKQHQT